MHAYNGNLLSDFYVNYNKMTNTIQLTAIRILDFVWDRIVAQMVEVLFKTYAFTDISH